ncbi:hypothetical protein F441_19652 [Phytophthora nicotianae CJ01A1]|uniref:Uncharacterized protein n=3 Tax=Phytophthora nicotianae TaxID=4792 RepID=V9E3I9_PHYNI|nr:hypothetical protein F443_19796 [Phytophthora nicotianae P1569]ETL27288.1 hypothetical protein L916_19140 [Phytophthora nicotianae]ETM33744.1 hypothetical protein L914_19042 [Phytophthora nicotianae]ETP03371.1 hypothetical protein F441_19652 [Phytophthora nicotianae CJ01A1]
MALYDALEYVSCGPVGLFLLLLLFNALNMAFSWTKHYVGISLVIVGVGLFSHRWHLCTESTVMPNAERLRATDGDPCDDYPAADGEASDNAVVEGGEHPHDGTEASPPDILDDFTAVEVFVVDVLRGLRTLSQRPAEASATTAPARAYHA